MLSIVGIIVGVLLARTNYLVSMERLRAEHQLGIERLRVKIAQGLHDDVGANLATIVMKLGMMKSRLKVPDEGKGKNQQLELDGARNRADFARNRMDYQCEARYPSKSHQSYEGSCLPDAG